MELDVLYAHIASLPVVTGFPALAQRIALGKLPHGAEIIVGIHARVLEERRPLPSIAMPALESPPASPPSALSVFDIPVPSVWELELLPPPQATVVPSLYDIPNDSVKTGETAEKETDLSRITDECADVQECSKQSSQLIGKGPRGRLGSGRGGKRVRGRE